jgi:SAM-dependent methyltransferase
MRIAPQCNRAAQSNVSIRMAALLYGDLVPWYRLIDPAKDHLDEATAYRDALDRAVSPRAETLLELGAGAGNNALFLKQRFRCTLTDISEGMQGLSRAANPDCEHVLGDMRTLRLGRTFDTVLVHDAIMYMTSEAELEAVAETAFVHTRPGGAALFAPDFVRETFRERTELHRNDEHDRTLCCLEWSWDPDPLDDTFVTEFSFLLRDRGTMRAVHDRHVEGLFSRATWLRILEHAGYTVESVPRPFDDEMTDEVFLCRRSAG